MSDESYEEWRKEQVELMEISHDIIGNQQFIADMLMRMGSVQRHRAALSVLRKLKYGMDFSVDGALEMPLMMPMQSSVPGVVFFRIFN